MANFTTRASIQILPIEEILFTDTTQKSKGIHSTLDRTFSAEFTTTHGTVSTNIAYGSYSLDAFEPAVLSAFIGSIVDVNFLFIRLLTGAEGASITVSEDGTNWASVGLLYPGEFLAGKWSKTMARTRIESFESAITFEIYCGKA